MRALVDWLKIFAPHFHWTTQKTIGQHRKLGRSSPFHSLAVPSSYFRSITLCFICPEITLGSHVFSELLCDCFGLACVHFLIGSKCSRHIFIGQRTKLGAGSLSYSPAVPSSYFRSITLCFICPEITLGSHVFSELLYDFCTGFVCEPHNNPADFFMDVIIECEASQRDGLVVSSGT